MKQLTSLLILLVLFTSCISTETIIEEPVEVLFLKAIQAKGTMYSFPPEHLQPGQELYIHPTWDELNSSLPIFTFYVKLGIETVNCAIGTFGSSPFLLDGTQSIPEGTHTADSVVIETIGLYGADEAKYIWTLTIVNDILSFEMHAIALEDNWDSTNWLLGSDWTLTFIDTAVLLKDIEICN